MKKRIRSKLLASGRIGVRKPHIARGNPSPGQSGHWSVTWLAFTTKPMPGATPVDAWRRFAAAHPIDEMRDALAEIAK